MPPRADVEDALRARERALAAGPRVTTFHPQQVDAPTVVADGFFGPDLNMTVYVDSDTLGRFVPDSFIGISREYTNESVYWDRNLDAWGALLDVLGPSPVIRVGGASQEALTAAPTAEYMRSLVALHCALGVRYIIGLPLFQNAPALALAIKRVYDKAFANFPKAVLSYELGNEARACLAVCLFVCLLACGGCLRGGGAAAGGGRAAAGGGRRAAGGGRRAARGRAACACRRQPAGRPRRAGPAGRAPSAAPRAPPAARAQPNYWPSGSAGAFIWGTGQTTCAKVNYPKPPELVPNGAGVMVPPGTQGQAGNYYLYTNYRPTYQARARARVPGALPLFAARAALAGVRPTWRPAARPPPRARARRSLTPPPPPPPPPPPTPPPPARRSPFSPTRSATRRARSTSTRGGRALPRTLASPPTRSQAATGRRRRSSRCGAAPTGGRPRRGAT